MSPGLNPPWHILVDRKPVGPKPKRSGKLATGQESWSAFPFNLFRAICARDMYPQTVMSTGGRWRDENIAGGGDRYAIAIPFFAYQDDA
ncbi:hypothetical protein Tco_0444579 [Tanacetum coccineum]